MNYPETIEYLYHYLPMFTRIGAAAYKKDLHNTLALLEALRNPQRKFRSIHIAGTNGKGSTSHMLAAVFHQNGYKTALYTSPHLKDFRERIKISNETTGKLDMVNEDFVVGFVEKVRPLIEKIEPSFFEVTVAMAFCFFAEQEADIAIIETGLGGRLDSTNVLQPELSIITNIGWDHMNILGDSLEKIAFEKAGIIKRNTPVIIGETLPATKPVFTDKANKENATIIFAEDWHISMVHATLEQLTVTLSNQNEVVEISSDLAGIYQQYNLRTVTSAVRYLQSGGWKLDDEKNVYALQHVKELTGLHGRWEIISKKPLIISDVAHNPDGIRQVLQQVDVMKSSIQKVHFITGMVKDKDVGEVLSMLPSRFQYYFTQAHLPRALNSNELHQKAKSFGLTGGRYDDVNSAIEAALAAYNEHDLILVCGSVFLAGEIKMERLQGIENR